MLMFNPNVVRFERFAAYYFSLLVTLGDEVAMADAIDVGVEGKLPAVNTSAPGFRILYEWISDFEAVIEGASPATFK